MNPRHSAWEADALPLSYSRLDRDFSRQIVPLSILQGNERLATLDMAMV